MPDYFVPLDTTKFTDFHRKLLSKSIAINADLKYVDVHRKELKAKYPSFNAFYKKYEVPEELIDEIISEGKKQKVVPKDEAELDRTLPYLKMQLKALIARDLWDMSQYYQIINESDDTVKKALEILEK